MNAQAVVAEFLERQRAMYLGGSVQAVEAMLAEDVVWHVPGTSAIAGDHRGRAAVVDYFVRRRALAGGAMAIVEHAEMCHGDTVVQLADGRAVLFGREAQWRTAGVYRVADGMIAEAWLIPLDLDAFDRAWNP